ncbi:MAG: HDOD domain-containing protein [Gemmatimonadaceae bacterium]|nr:HDOD domain-containing protein [Gemmatimonadaceae bacterium]
MTAEVHLARQPIFDRTDSLHGYELLYRASPTATAATGTDTETMTAATFVNAALAIGIPQLTAGTRAFVNIPRQLLISRHWELLDPTQVTLELLETITPDLEVLKAATAARDAGYVLALDDFVGGEEYDPLLRLASVVKVDVLDASDAALLHMTQRLERYDATLLAERVETREMLERCRGLGYGLFQGYYFSRPEIVTRPDLPPESARVAQLMRMASDDGTHENELEEALRTDPVLTYKLLRIANSAAIGRGGIETVRQALRVVGRGTLHRWLTLLFMTSAPLRSGVEKALLRSCLEQGRMCELTAEAVGRKNIASPLFLTGLLSRLDAVLGVPIKELASALGLGAEVQAALRREEGPYTPFLAVTEAYERGDFDRALSAASLMGVDDLLPAIYTDAVQWTAEVLAT